MAGAEATLAASATDVEGREVEVEDDTEGTFHDQTQPTAEGSDLAGNQRDSDFARAAESK
jgi:hypothetical protein